MGSVGPTSFPGSRDRLLIQSEVLGMQAFALSLLEQQALHCKSGLVLATSQPTDFTSGPLSWSIKPIFLQNKTGLPSWTTRKLGVPFSFPTHKTNWVVPTHPHDILRSRER